MCAFKIEISSGEKLLISFKFLAVKAQPRVFFSPFSPSEYEHTMKRRVDDQELIFSPQQQQSRRPQVQAVADSFQPRALAPTPAVIEAAADSMQPSAGIQYSLPQGYQVTTAGRRM